MKPTGKMADLAETKKNSSLLLGDIHKHLLDQHGKPTDRRQDIIHPSEMAKSDWCPRQTYYRLAGVSPEKDRSFNAQLEAIFMEGHGIHSKWQKWLQQMDRLWGKWVCPVCGDWEMGVGGRLTCQSCRNRTSMASLPVYLEYAEVPLNAEAEFLIAGHEDGALEDLNALVEIKSIGIGTVRFDHPKLLLEYTVKTEDGKTVIDLDGLWKGLRRPFGSHIRQTQIYLRLCKEMGLPFDKVIFLYEYKATQAHKEFVIHYNPEISEPLFDTALDIKYALKKGKPPPRPGFTGQDTKVCKDCPFFNHCWETTTDGTSDSTEGLGSGSGAVAEGDQAAGEGGPVSPAAAGGRRARTTRGSHRTKRQRTDEPVREDDSVGGVHRQPTGSSGGGRKVVRRHTRKI
jgi:CRISPR/Cas system-associated exonuclease Cas4 (RecB family)